MEAFNVNQTIEKVKSQMRKGILEYCILLILHQREAYSADIIRILQESKLIIVEGTLYPLLSRLKNLGLLSYSWVESTQGPPRKYYKITEKGDYFLTHLNDAWLEISHAVEDLSRRDFPALPAQEYISVSEPIDTIQNDEKDHSDQPL